MIYSHLEQNNADVTVDQLNENTCTILVRKADGTLLLNAAISKHNAVININGPWDVAK